MMQRTMPFISALLIVNAGLSVAFADAPQNAAAPGLQKPREVPARTVPVPTTVSPRLQGVIAAPTMTELLAVPKDAAGWHALVATSDLRAAQGARALWRQLGVSVTPANIAGVNCYKIVPAQAAPENRNRLVVHLHSGVYILNGGEAATGEGALIAFSTKTSVLSVDYRMPPDHPFPADVDDVVAVWSAVVKDHDPAKIALFGSSTGGRLAMATVLKLEALHLPLPGALFLGAPSADLTKTGDTWFTNEHVDNALGAYSGLFEGAAKLYAGNRDMEEPLLSPIYGDLHGFPPSILISGTRDLLLSDTVRTHRKLRQAGVDAELHVFEGVSHGQYLTSFPSPEAAEAMSEVTHFFDRHLAR